MLASGERYRWNYLKIYHNTNSSECIIIPIDLRGVEFNPPNIWSALYQAVSEGDASVPSEYAPCWGYTGNEVFTMFYMVKQGTTYYIYPKGHSYLTYLQYTIGSLTNVVLEVCAPGVYYVG